MKIILEMNQKQAIVLMDALETFSRIKMGQFDVIQTAFVLRDFDRQIASSYAKALRRTIMPELSDNAYYGIFSKEAGTGAEAWDVYQVIRHAIAWKRNPRGGMTIDYDKPMAASKEPLPKITIVTGEQI